MFNHADAQRVYFKTVLTRCSGDQIEELNVLVVEFDYGISYDYSKPHRGQAFESLVSAARESLEGWSEIDRIEIVPTAFALSRSE